VSSWPAAGGAFRKEITKTHNYLSPKLSFDAAVSSPLGMTGARHGVTGANLKRPVPLYESNERGRSFSRWKNRGGDADKKASRGYLLLEVFFSLEADAFSGCLARDGAKRCCLFLPALRRWEDGSLLTAAV